MDHGPCAGGLWCDAEGIAETPLAARRHVVVAGNGGGVVALQAAWSGPRAGEAGLNVDQRASGGGREAGRVGRFRAD